MALTPEQIDRLIQQADGPAPKEGSIFRALVKLTEVEVRKQDDELIRQMVDALENGKKVRQCEGGTKYQPILEDAAITAAKERLSEEA